MIGRASPSNAARAALGRLRDDPSRLDVTAP
jgi:hypothetical protein